MTELKKAVSRRTTILLDNRERARDRDRITVTLYPNGTIGFRALRARREVRTTLAAAYRQARS